MPVTRTEVTEIYVATFDRAPDTAGLDYWVGTGLTIEEIAQSFFAQDETLEKYPATMTEAEFVNEVYNNVYNRDGDPDGIVYWVGELDGGTPRNVMILAMINGAQGTDEDVLSNKTEVGLAFADAGLSDYDDSVSIMSEITDDDATVDSAIVQIDLWTEDLATTQFTIERDTLAGTEGANIFEGLWTGDATTDTYQGFDAVDGLGGEDTLIITDTDTDVSMMGATSVKNIETLKVTNAGGVATVDLANYDSSVENIIVDGSADTVFGTATVGFDHVVDKLEISNSAISTTTINYEADAVDSADDTMDITLSATGAQTFVTNGIEEMDIHGVSGNQEIIIDAATVTNVTVDGAANTTIAAAIGTTIADIDASTATGNITVEASALSVTDATVKGGLGNDTLNGTATADGTLNIYGNEGSDNIIGGASVVNSVSKYYGGADNDTITVAAATNGVNTLNGGTGVDIMTASASTVDTFSFAKTGDTGATLTDSDTINGFVTSIDKINFADLAAGDIDNFAAAAAAVADFAEGKTAADTYFNEDGETYYYATDGTDGYLYVDSNQDGTTDEILQMAGLTDIADIVAGDII